MVFGFLCLQDALSPSLHPKPYLVKKNLRPANGEQPELLRNLADLLEKRRAEHACMSGDLPWTGSEEQVEAL